MNTTEENMNILLAELGKSPIYTIEKWDITKEEETLFEGAEVGQTIQLESRREPVLLEDKETDGILIPAYTSDMEIAADKKREYTVSTIPFQSMAAYVCRLTDNLKRNVGIVLDGDGKEHLIIPGSVLSERIP